MINFKALLAEGIGTFALIFAGVLAINNLGRAESGLIGIALAHGLALACLITATGAVSGGHLNPAVSFGLWLAKKIDAKTMVAYWVAQCLGALAAAACVGLVVVGNGKLIVANGTPALGHDVTMTGAIIAEVITTFFLVFVVLGTAVDGRAPKMGGLFVGLVVTMDILAIGPITGAAMNPARWFGPAIYSGSFDNAAVYIVGPLVGGALAALAYVGAMQEKTSAATS